MERHKVGFRKNAVPVGHQLHPFGHLADVGIVGEHPHAETAVRHPGDAAADASAADDAERLARDLNARRAVLCRKADLTVLAADRRQIFRQRNEHRKRVLGNRRAVGARRDRHRHAMLLRGLKIDIVHAHAVLGDQLELRAVLKELSSHFGDAHEQRVRVAHMLRRDLDTAAQVPFHDLMARRLEQTDPDGVDLLGHYDLRHFSLPPLLSGRAAHWKQTVCGRQDSLSLFFYFSGIPVCCQSSKRTNLITVRYHEPDGADPCRAQKNAVGEISHGVFMELLNCSPCRSVT